MFVLVNLKAYPCDPVAVAEAARTVADDTGVRIAVAPQAAGLGAVADTGVETWAQDVSPVDHGDADAGVVGDDSSGLGDGHRVTRVRLQVDKDEHTGWRWPGAK